MRVFIAIDIDAQVRKALGDLQQELAGRAGIRNGDVKWVRPEVIHLTLKFLGEIENESVVEVCGITEGVAARHGSFELDVESVGHFGGRSARVVWVGSGKGSDELLGLQQDLEQKLAEAGWPRESRKFTVHLTLCRIRNPKAGIELAQITEAYKDYKLGSIVADSVTVYQSQLRPSGPVYTPLGRYELRNQT